MSKRGLLEAIGRRMPSPAMVVACIALAVALGGTSYAAIRLPANSVGTKQLKRGAVTGVKVKSNALTGTQINEGTLAKVRFSAQADRALDAVTADTADSAPLSRLDYQATVTALPASGAVTRGTVACPSGLFATGGGAKIADPNQGYVIDTNPVGRTGWEATGASQIAQNMTVYVICAPATSNTP